MRAYLGQRCSACPSGSIAAYAHSQQCPPKSHGARLRAGVDADSLPDMTKLLEIFEAVEYRLCNISKAVTVDLFCGGVLGALLVLARRLVSTKPHAGGVRQSHAALLFKEGLVPTVDMFGQAVPRARVQLLPAAALASVCFFVLGDGAAWLTMCRSPRRWPKSMR